MEKIKQSFMAGKLKKVTYVALIAILIGWVIFRFAAVASENARNVFNASRVAMDVGAPVTVVEMRRRDAALYEPLAVKNNRAYVSGERAAKLRSGQKISTGRIVSVSSNLDLATGMYAVRTSGVANGLHFAEYHTNGFFVPLSAISNGTVFIVQDGVAVPRSVKIARQDAENALIESGINAGDIVILSTVQAGDKVQIKK